ncbi:MAG: hypothetical protein FWC15_05905 [Fibromonadales bacterium]|nr:hypothetical protein [Fibromonadales bacterium]
MLAAFLAFFACKENSNDDAFILAYADLRIEGKTDVLQKHGFSVDDFEAKLEALKKEPERWKNFQTKLIKVLDSIANEEKE